MKSCVLVTGMHRSGTSFASSVVNSLGYCLGYENEYSDEENPKGYFENFEAVSINDSILALDNQSWYTVKFTDVIKYQNEKYSEIKGRAKEFLKKLFANTDKVVIKDPRFCLTIGLWIPLFKELSIDVKCLIMFRHPDEVAISQQTRKIRNPDYFKFGTNIELTKLVWLNHYRSALAQLDEINLAMVDYRFLHHQQKQFWDFIGSFLNVEHEIVPDSQLYEAGLYRSHVMETPKYSEYAGLYESLDLAFDGASQVSDSKKRILREMFSRSIQFDFDTIMPVMNELLVENNKTEKKVNEKTKSELTVLRNLLDECRESNARNDVALKETESLAFDRLRQIEVLASNTSVDEDLVARLSAEKNLADERLSYIQELSDALVETQELAIARLDEIETLQKEVLTLSSEQDS